MLEGWDDEARKYKESGTGGLHTKERCQEAKAKLKQTIGPAPTTEYLEAKNDHGNELTESRQNNAWKTSNVGTNTLSEQEKLGYVDHTQQAKGKGQSKTKIFFSEQPDKVTDEYNNFLAQNNGRIRTQGAHDHVTMQQDNDSLMFTIFLYYEEVTKQ
jgi:hypothetical protein